MYRFVNLFSQAAKSPLSAVPSSASGNGLDAPARLKAGPLQDQVGTAALRPEPSEVKTRPLDSWGKSSCTCGSEWGGRGSGAGSGGRVEPGQGLDPLEPVLVPGGSRGVRGSALLPGHEGLLMLLATGVHARASPHQEEVPAALAL